MGMNPIKIRSMKALKLLGLLISSMIIATASAGVYYTLTMTSTISVATTDVRFINGTDAQAAGVQLGQKNTTVTLTNLKAYPNATYTYTDPIRLKNFAGTGSYKVSLKHVSISSGSTQFVFVNFTLQSPTKISLNYTYVGSSWNIPPETSQVTMNAGDVWSIVIQTKAKDGATSDSVTIQIAVDVE